MVHHERHSFILRSFLLILDIHRYIFNIFIQKAYFIGQFFIDFGSHSWLGFKRFLFFGTLKVSLQQLLDLDLVPRQIIWHFIQVVNRHRFHPVGQLVWPMTFGFLTPLTFGSLLWNRILIHLFSKFLSRNQSFLAILIIIGNLLLSSLCRPPYIICIGWLHLRQPLMPIFGSARPIELLFFYFFFLFFGVAATH